MKIQVCSMDFNWNPAKTWLRQYRSATTQKHFLYIRIHALFRMLQFSFSSKRPRPLATSLVKEFTDASNDDTTGLSLHRLSPYNAYYLKYTTLYLYIPRFQVVCDIFLKVLIELQLILHCDSTFQWSTTLLLKTNFLTSSLNLLLYKYGSKVSGAHILFRLPPADFFSPFVVFYPFLLSRDALQQLELEGLQSAMSYPWLLERRWSPNDSPLIQCRQIYWFSRSELIAHHCLATCNHRRFSWSK